MKILEYSDIDTSKVRRQYEKVIASLKRDDFRSAGVKKFAEHDLYSARLDDSNRLLFKLVKYQGMHYALILEIVLNHAYDRSKFLRGIKIDESKVPSIEDKGQIKDETLTSLIYINPNDKHFYFLDKIISFDPEQENVYRIHPPLIIIGPAGSGKTAITLEKMKQFHGNGIYVTLSPYLAENSRKIYYSHHYENYHQEVLFLSFREFLETMRVPEGKEVRYNAFVSWLFRFPKHYRIADPHRLYEEFRGVITGFNIDKPYLSKDEYLNLGVRQSLFPDNQRELVYELFEKYLIFLKDSSFYDPNILAHSYLKDVNQVYDFVVIDEVQDITNIQLQIILKSLKSNNNFILCGDSNQIVHPNFFSWSKVKSMLYESASFDTKKVTRILQSNFRNSKSITELSNMLIKIKQKRFGSIDRESTYLMNSLSEKNGKIIFLKDIDKVKHNLNLSIRRSTKFAVLVMRDEEKALARKFFDTPLLFSIHEAKGLEYENVILLNFVSGQRQYFHEIIKGIKNEDIKEDIRYMRASDKTDKSLEVYKFFINSFYVAVTRAVEELYIIESDISHPYLQMLGLSNPTEHATIKVEQSSKEEWQAEARRLELQGKYEQANEIRRNILGTQPVPWEVTTPQRILALSSQILVAKDNPQKPRKILFEYALAYDAPKIIEFLSKYNFDKAKQIYLMQQEKPFFNWSLYEQQKSNFGIKNLQKYTGNFNKEVLRHCELYGIDHRTEFNKTPLMIAARVGNIQLIKELLTAGANSELTDNCGQTAWQNALQRAIMDKEFASTLFPQTNEMLAPSTISLKIDNRLIKIDNSMGEFILFHIFFATLPYRVNYFEPHRISLSALELAEIAERIPDSIIKDYRKKRHYISSLLSKNETNSTNPYCKKLFKRIKTGHYILNTDCEIKQNDEWINIYKHAGIEMICSMDSNAENAYNDFMKAILLSNNVIANKQSHHESEKVVKDSKNIDEYSINTEDEFDKEYEIKIKGKVINVKAKTKSEAKARALFEFDKQGKLFND